jgi:DNA-binding transcriptional LysR family regulator
VRLIREHYGGGDAGDRLTRRQPRGRSPEADPDQQSMRRDAELAPVDIRLRGDCSYFLVYPREKAELPKVRAFQEWITGEAARTRAKLGSRAVA